MYIEDGFTRRAQGPSTIVKHRTVTGKTPAVPSGTHQLPIHVGQETQQSSFAERSNQQPIAVQPLQTRTGHPWRPVTGQPVPSTGSGRSWQAVKGHSGSSTGSGHSWQAVKGHPVSSIGKGNSWQPVAGIPSQLHVIEPVNRSWKTEREGAITCELCAYTTERKEKYVEHLQCHITQRYMCKICGRACLKVNIFIIFFIINCHIFLLYFPVARPQTIQANDTRTDSENIDSRKDAKNRPSEETTASNVEKPATSTAKPNFKNLEGDEVVEIMTDLGITIANQPDSAVVKRIRDFYNSEAKKAETAKCIRHLNMWWKTRKVRRFECASCYYQTDEPDKYKQHLLCHGQQFTCKLCTRKCLEVNECFSWCLEVLFTLYFELIAESAVQIFFLIDLLLPVELSF